MVSGRGAADGNPEGGIPVISGLVSGIPADAFRVAAAQADSRLGAVADQVDSQLREGDFPGGYRPQAEFQGRGEFQRPAVDSAENHQLPHLPVFLRDATSAGRD